MAFHSFKQDPFLISPTKHYWGVWAGSWASSSSDTILFSSTRPQTETGGGADLLHCITLTDRLIVDKQLNSMPEPPRSPPLHRLTVRCCAVIWWRSPRMTTILHPSLSLRHKRVLCGARCSCLLVSLCHHYGVTDRITRTADEVRVESTPPQLGQESPRSTSIPSSAHSSSYIWLCGDWALGSPSGKDTVQSPGW